MQVIHPDDVLDRVKAAKEWKLISREKALIHCSFEPVVVVYTIQGKKRAALLGPKYGFVGLGLEIAAFLHVSGTEFYEQKNQACSAQFPTDVNIGLLSRLIAGEATTSLNSKSEMAAIAYTAVNRVNYLRGNPNIPPSFFGASSATLSGVINKNQYGSVDNPMWKQAATPDGINVNAPKGMQLCSFFSNAYSVAAGVVSGAIPDPFASYGGTYGMRTAGHGSPGGRFVAFPASAQIEGSGNIFFGLKQ
jgi:hypothetical protein